MQDLSQRARRLTRAATMFAALCVCVYPRWIAVTDRERQVGDNSQIFTRTVYLKRSFLLRPPDKPHDIEAVRAEAVRAGYIGTADARVIPDYRVRPDWL